MSKMWHSMKTFHKKKGTKVRRREFEAAEKVTHSDKTITRDMGSHWVEIGLDEKVVDVRFLSEAAPRSIAKCQ